MGLDRKSSLGDVEAGATVEFDERKSGTGGPLTVASIYELFPVVLVVDEKEDRRSVSRIDVKGCLPGGGGRRLPAGKLPKLDRRSPIPIPTSSTFSLDDNNACSLLLVDGYTTCCLYSACSDGSLSPRGLFRLFSKNPDSFPGEFKTSTLLEPLLTTLPDRIGCEEGGDDERAAANFDTGFKAWSKFTAGCTRLLRDISATSPLYIGAMLLKYLFYRWGRDWSR